MPQPAAGRGRAETAPIYLPARQGYSTVHLKYVEACATVGQWPCFSCIWHNNLPHIKFMTPRTDVCHCCEKFWVQLKDAVKESRLTTEFKQHVKNAQDESEHY